MLRAVLLVVGLSWAPAAEADVFHSRESALRLAFPGADRVETRTFFLTEAQRSAVERRAGSAPESRMVSCYVGWQGGQPTGYAFLDTHVVRTLPETFLVVVEPSGSVRAVHILAFHEPSEYLPPRRWLQQLVGKRMSRTLAVNRDVDVITGASLSSEAVTAGVRRILSLFEVLVLQRTGS